MEIKLNKLHIVNFKGVKDLEINFNESITDIYGDNATGKTTIFDAFTWLLFGKDSSDKKDFNIKTLDKENKPIHYLDHEVSSILFVDGVKIQLKRTFREKWVKRRGEVETTFSGHETVFFWNEVPMSEGEYKAKVSSLIDENIFKLITSTTFFNLNLKWQERRKILLDLAGEISPAQILAELEKNGVDITGLESAFAENKTVEDYKKEIAAKKLKIKHELQLIPSRIDEVGRSMPEIEDWDSIERNINTTALLADQIDKQLESVVKANNAKNEAVLAHNNNVFKLKQLLQKAEQDAQHLAKKPLLDAQYKLVGLRNDLLSTRSNYDSQNRRLSDLASRKAVFQKDLDYERATWIEENGLEFSEDCEKECPTCGRAFEQDVLGEKLTHLRERFNSKKIYRLNVIHKTADSLKLNIASIEKQETDLRTQVVLLKSSLETLEHHVKEQEEFISNLSLTEPEKSEAVAKIESEIKLLEKNAPAEVTGDEQIQVLKGEKQEHGLRIDELKKRLANREQIERLTLRSNELKSSEKTMSQEVANLEKEEYAILRYTKVQMEIMELTINGKFSYVMFKLFSEQINGGEAETCETLVDGVPYSDLNTASRINAGVDIINALSLHYGAIAPIFIDNRESVVRLLDTNAQTINLIVSENDKKLRVA